MLLMMMLTKVAAGKRGRGIRPVPPCPSPLLAAAAQMLLLVLVHLLGIQDDDQLRLGPLVLP
jgi:hypothetical protein